MSIFEAQNAVQDRKQACGMSEFSAVLVGEAEIPWADENLGMLAGTGITESELSDLAHHYSGAARAMLVTGLSFAQVVDAIFREGVLIGVEHAKREKLI